MSNVVSSVVGGIFGNKAADKAADAQTDAARIAAEQFAPYSITSPFGAFNVDRYNKQITTSLSGDAKQMLEMFSGETMQSLDDATASRLDILDQLAARGETDAREANEKRLFRAGALGTYAGARQIGEVESAIADARLGRMLSARDLAFNERQGAFSNALNLLQLPMTMAGASMNRNPAAAISAMGYQNAALTRGAADLGFAGQAGNIAGAAFDAVPWGKAWDSISSVFGGGSTASAFGADMYGTTAGGALYSPF